MRMFAVINFRELGFLQNFAMSQLFLDPLMTDPNLTYKWRPDLRDFQY